MDETSSLPALRAVNVSPASALSLLRRNDLFRELPQHFLEKMLRRARNVYVEPKTLVLQQLEPGDTMFLVVKGVLDVTWECESGRSVSIAQLGEGDIVGELSLLDGRARSATVVTRTASHLWEFSREVVISLLKDEPQALWKMLEAVTMRLRDTNRRLSYRGLEPVATRVARFLLDFYYTRRYDKGPHGGYLLPRWVSISAIAEQVGVVRETVSKVIGDWRNQGYLTKKGYRIELLEVSMLEQEVFS